MGEFEKWFRTLNIGENMHTFKRMESTWYASQSAERERVLRVIDEKIALLEKDSVEAKKAGHKLIITQAAIAMYELKQLRRKLSNG